VDKLRTIPQEVIGLYECISPPTKELTQSGGVRESGSRLFWVCLAIPALKASLGSITDMLNTNWDCAFRGG